MQIRKQLMLACLTALASGAAAAGDLYPSRPVHIVVPYGTGGGTDIAARILAAQLSEQMARSFLVENRPGASGTVGAAYVSKSAPDGHVLAMADPSWATVGGLYKSLSYAVDRDFTAISQLIRVPNAMVVKASPQFNSLRDFIDAAKTSPGRFNFGSSGPGGINHLAPELFKKSAGINLVHIAYKSGGETITGLLGDQVHMLIAPVLSFLPLIQAGKLRALAVTTDGKRVGVLPDVPSMTESGVSGMDVYYWAGLVGPAGMPRDVVSTLHNETVKALGVATVREKFIAQSADIVASTPDAFSAHIRREVRRWAEVIKSAGITPE